MCCLISSKVGRTDPKNELRWDAEGWVGTDMNRLWIKSGGFAGNGTVSDGDHELLYDRPISHTRYSTPRAASEPMWTRIPVACGQPWASRAWRLLFQPRADLLHQRRWAHGRTDKRLVGSLCYAALGSATAGRAEFLQQGRSGTRNGLGLLGIDAGIRLRYEVTRKINSLYWMGLRRKYGNSAVYTRQSGGATNNSRFIFGFRVWY